MFLETCPTNLVFVSVITRVSEKYTKKSERRGKEEDNSCAWRSVYDLLSYYDSVSTFLDIFLRPSIKSSLHVTSRHIHTSFHLNTHLSLLTVHCSALVEENRKYSPLMFALWTFPSFLNLSYQSCILKKVNMTAALMGRKSLPSSV